MRNYHADATHPRPMPRAWLSSRVSSGPQERLGGGHRRQESAAAVDAAQRWCNRNGYDLEQETLRFTGSAYRGAHMRPGAPQREWLERAIRGELGDRPALLVESVDRLTRQAGHEADGGLAELLYRAFPAGVVIVDLGDGVTYSTEAFNRDDRLLGDLIEEARLAHRESVKKSRRLASHWDQVRSDIAAGRIVRPRQLAPWWVSAVDRRWELNDKAPLAQRIFSLALDHGSVIITRTLNDEGITPPGRRQGPRWTASAVVATLRNPAAWGCCRITGCDPIPDVFPPLITCEQFDLVQARIASRVGDPSTRGHRLETRWIGAGLSHCTCGWAVGSVANNTRRGRTWRYIGCLRHRDHGRTCRARFIPLDVANAHLLTRLSHGQLAAMLNSPERHGQLHAARVAERQAREALEVARQRRSHAEEAVKAAVLRGQEHSLLLEVANDARAAESAARQAAAEAAAGVSACLQSAPTAPIEGLVRELFLAVATGTDTADQRREVNRGLGSLGVRITIDVSGEPARMALQIGEGPTEWQPIDRELAGYALRAAATGAVFGDSIVSWKT
jgi:hypothetical protein